MTTYDNTLDAVLGTYSDDIEAAYSNLRDNQVIERIWKRDYTVWQDEPTEITDRLGWLESMDEMKSNLDRLAHLEHAIKEAGYTHALVLGMGGSSLAPELFGVVFGRKEDGLWLQILDSTDPGAVLHYRKTLDIEKTLFIVATKSGGTAETLSFFKYFYQETLSHYDGDKDKAGAHFIGITDPGSKLKGISERNRFRALFLNKPDIGGRYSVLSYFGLLPATLAGVDVETLLDRADKMAINCGAPETPSQGDNQGGRLGTIMGTLAEQGRDKLTLLLSPPIAHFGEWVEQLIAESTGKEGKGILPVMGEPVAAPDTYGDDRLFVYMRLKGNRTYDDAVQALTEAGQPVVTLHLDDLYDLGGQFFLWEMATAVAGHIMGIHPFNQPNVEAAKVQARKMIDEYEDTGKLPELDATLSGDGIAVYGDIDAETPADALKTFIEQDGAYIALHAYLTPNEQTSDALEKLQAALRDATGLAVTAGYGPRFLHSTGQLHKGDAGNGLFIQFTAEMPEDIAIPDEPDSDASAMSFGTLKEAQALGDRQALLDAGRQVLRFRFANTRSGLETLTAALRA